MLVAAVTPCAARYEPCKAAAAHLPLTTHMLGLGRHCDSDADLQRCPLMFGLPLAGIRSRCSRGLVWGQCGCCNYSMRFHHCSSMCTMGSGYSAEQVTRTQSRTQRCKCDNPLGPGSLHISTSLVVNTGHQPCWPGQMSPRMLVAADMTQDPQQRRAGACISNLNLKSCKLARCTSLCDFQCFAVPICVLPSTTVNLLPFSSQRWLGTGIVACTQADTLMTMLTNATRSPLQQPCCCSTRSPGIACELLLRHPTLAHIFITSCTDAASMNR